MQFRLFLLLVIAFLGKAYAQVPPQVVLTPGQELFFSGNFGDQVRCDGNTFKRAAFHIQVVKEICSRCEGGFSYKVYEDGVLKGTCPEEPQTPPKDRLETFINFPMLNNLTDAEVVKLAGQQQLGTCQFRFDQSAKKISIQVNSTRGEWSNDNNNAANKAVNDLLSSIHAQNTRELNADKFSDKVRAKTIKDALDQDVCGSFSDELIAENLVKQNKILGQNDVGFDYFVAQGKTGEDMLKMSYPVRKIRDQFHLAAADFKRYGVSTWDMRNGGFTPAELKEGNYSLSAIMGGGYDIRRDLKPIFSASEFKAINTSAWDMRNYGFNSAELHSAGYTLSQMMGGGFDVKNDLKREYPIADFKSLNTSAWDMRNYGYSVGELKNAGYTLSQIMGGGFDVRRDIKPLYEIRDFRGLNVSYWDLRSSYGYSARELRDSGARLNELMGAGFDVRNDLKSLYSVSDFKSISTSAWDMRNYGFTVADLKNEYTLSQIMGGGFDVRSQIKPNYSANDFKNIGTSAWDMRNYGFSARELFTAGYSKDQLRGGGYSNAEIDAL